MASFSYSHRSSASHKVTRHFNLSMTPTGVTMTAKRSRCKQGDFVVSRRPKGHQWIRGLVVGLRTERARTVILASVVVYMPNHLIARIGCCIMSMGLEIPCHTFVCVDFHLAPLSYFGSYHAVRKSARYGFEREHDGDFVDVVKLTKKTRRPRPECLRKFPAEIDCKEYRQHSKPEFAWIEGEYQCGGWSNQVLSRLQDSLVSAAVFQCNSHNAKMQSFTNSTLAL